MGEGPIGSSLFWTCICIGKSLNYNELIFLEIHIKCGKEDMDRIGGDAQNTKIIEIYLMPKSIDKL